MKMFVASIATQVGDEENKIASDQQGAESRWGSWVIPQGKHMNHINSDKAGMTSNKTKH